MVYDVMKKLLVLGLLLLPGTALAQNCNGQFGAGTVCGNRSSSTGFPSATNQPVLGKPGTSDGTLGFASTGGGTGTVSQKSTASALQFFLPTIAGTFPTTATSPITLDSTTGVVACTTCVTGPTPGGEALTATSDTNVTLTLGGSPTNALVNAASVTAGWTGTLAAGRLNSNVVQSVTNDTNVTGSIAAQNLTLGWAGQLGLTRGGTNASLAASNGGIFYSTASAGAILAGTANASRPLLSGSSTTPSWAAVSYPTSATSGGVPYFSSTSAMASSAALTANRIVLGGGAGAAPTIVGSLGTTTTVLHGNASGAPTFSAVSLTADVSGTLPVANGGTNVTSATDTSATIVGRALSIQNSGSTNNSSSGSGSYQAMTPTVSIPASYITTNRMLKVKVFLLLNTSTPDSLAFKLSLGGTDIAEQTGAAPASSLTNRLYTTEIDIIGLAAPSASSNVAAAILGNTNSYASALLINNIAQPVALATNGALTLQISTRWLTAGTGTNTVQLYALTVETAN